MTLAKKIKSWGRKYAPYLQELADNYLEGAE